MGIIAGKLWRKKTTVEVLETLDKEIKTIEEYRKTTELSHKRIVGRFIVISVGIYLVTAFLFYFYFFPATFYDRLFYIIPLILAPVIILTVKRVLTWYYKWKISRKQNKLSTLRDEKKKLLEKVMETETYKVAKTILEKYSEATARKSTTLISPSDIATPRKTVGIPGPTGGLRQRALPAPPNNHQLLPATPIRPLPVTGPNTTLRQGIGRTQMLPPSAVPAIPGTPLPMPRAILPRERSVFDKMVDYLVGDGPSNRYALICKNCSSHNGMAFREEFEYISFRCCYCFILNPARKKRPVAPKLDFELKPLHQQSDTSESEKNSPSDTDSEPGTPIKHLKHETPKSDVVEDEESKEMDPVDDIEADESVPMDLDLSLEEREETVIEDDKVEDIEEEKEEENETVKVTDGPNGDGSGIVTETD